MNIIEIKEQHIARAAEVLTIAFKEDPIFRYIFQTPEKYQAAAPWLFGTWIKWSMLYGVAWMDEEGTAVMLLRAIGKPGMSFWSMIRAGMLPTPYKLGWSAFKRFYFNVVALLDKKHAEIMGHTLHWYGWMAGVTEPGKGMVRELFQRCQQIADREQLPIFLETATVTNIEIYNHKDFEVKDQVQLSADCTIYFMVRPPHKTPANTIE